MSNGGGNLLVRALHKRRVALITILSVLVAALPSASAFVNFDSLRAMNFANFKLARKHVSERLSPCCFQLKSFLRSSNSNSRAVFNLNHNSCAKRNSIPDSEVTIGQVSMTTEMSVARAMLQVVNWAYRGKPGSPGWTDESAIMEGPRTSLEALVRLLLSCKENESVVFYALVGKQVAGCIHVQMTENQVAEFGLFAVDPQYQSCGLGRRLLDTAEKYAVQTWSASRGRMKMINCRDDLYEWYKKRGYVKTGATEPFPEGMTDTPKIPIHFCILERPLP